MILTPSYKRPAELRRCLGSLKETVSNDNLYDLLIVDDCSPCEMGYGEILESHHPYNHPLGNGNNWKVIKTPQNGGFTKCVNYGIRYLWKKDHQYKYMLLLNNDATLNHGWLQKMTAAFNDQMKVGVVAPYLAVWCPDSIYPTPPGSNEQYPHEKNENPIDVRNRMVKELGISEWFEEHVGFWGVLIRFDLFERFGLFDEDFKVICQDLDFCWRIGREGWKIKVMSEGNNHSIWHVGHTHVDLKPKSEIDP